MIDDLILAEQLLKKTKLSETTKSVFIGYFIYGKTYKEIARDFQRRDCFAVYHVKKGLSEIRRQKCFPIFSGNFELIGWGLD